MISRYEIVPWFNMSSSPSVKRRSGLSSLNITATHSIIFHIPDARTLNGSFPTLHQRPVLLASGMFTTTPLEHRMADPWTSRRLAICMRNRQSLPRPVQQLADHLKTFATV